MVLQVFGKLPVIIYLQLKSHRWIIAPATDHSGSLQTALSKLPRRKTRGHPHMSSRGSPDRDLTLMGTYEEGDAGITSHRAGTLERTLVTIGVRGLCAR